MKKNALIRLGSLLTQLAADASDIDTANKQKKSHYYLQDRPLFDDKLFPIASSSYVAYVKYAQQRLTHLNKLLETDHNDFSDVMFSQLEEQTLSLITAIKSNDSRHHDGDYRLDRRNRLNAQKHKKQPNNYKNMAKAIMVPSHQLHAKLAEVIGFERRLEEMIRIKELELSNKRVKDTSALQLEVLTLHQRLGRCRKAKSEIEREIELSEKSR